MDSYVSPRTKPLFRSVQIVWALLGLIEVLLAFRLVLKLLGANPYAGFTDFIYTFSSPFMAPFVAVFPTTKAGGAVFEWTALLAMVVYYLLAYGFSKLFVMSKDVSTPEAAQKLERENIT